MAAPFNIPEGENDMQTEVSKTKMVAPQPEEKIKLQVLHRVELDKKLLNVGDTLEVSREEAKTLLTMSVEGQYDFSGERTGIQKKPRIHYFKLIKEVSPMDELEKLQNS